MAVEKAWIIEDSPWWKVLLDPVKTIILRDYKEAGLVTESNATINPRLDSFLNQYYQGENRREFSVQQREAIQAVNGVTLLFAVPGSGKTTVIVARAGYMIHVMNIPPQRHLIMTYNKAAAAEMKNRYQKTYPDDGSNIPDFRTIHSFCYKVISSLKSKGEIFPLMLRTSEDNSNPDKRQERNKIIAAAVCGVSIDNPNLIPVIKKVVPLLNKADYHERAKNNICLNGITLDEIVNSWRRKDVKQTDIIEKIMNKNHYDEDANSLIETICTIISFIKNRMLSREEIRKITYKEEKKEYQIEPIYTAYQQYLQKENLMDYDDMLLRAYIGIKKYPDILRMYQDCYPYISLDEAQDTSLLQHEIVSLIVGKRGNLFMVGDDDQSIYAFRGAVPSEMLNFPKRYPQGRKLLMGTNYRSDIDIVKAADRFIQANKKRENKLMRPSSIKPGSIKIVLIPNLSAQYEYITNAALECLKDPDKGNDLAILYRWNISALPVMVYLFINHVSFYCDKIKETLDSVLKAQEVKRIIEIFKYCKNPNSLSAFRDAWYICYLDIIKSWDNEGEIEKIWKEGAAPSIYDAVITFLESKCLSEKIEDFKEAYDKVMTMTNDLPRNAIIFMMKQIEYGIIHPDGDDSIAAWMRVYAVLSAAEACDNIDGFLNLIDELNQKALSNKKEKTKIRLCAMHSSKGAEFSRVIIIDTLEDITPGTAAGNEVWYDSEEERRLFYVASTRAKHELDILQVDVYHDRHHKQSRFVEALHASNQNIEVISYRDNKNRSMFRFKMPHYVIRQGKFADIYSNKEEIEEIRKKRPEIEAFICDTYADAVIYMHKGDTHLNRKLVNMIPADLPRKLTEQIWSFFGVKSADELTSRQLTDIKRKAELFMTTGETNYGNCAKEYALMYLTVNIYKVWKPLMEMLPSGRLPVDGTVKILEIGAGPGTATLGIILFYYSLALCNPQRDFRIEYHIIEREAAFIEIFERLIRNCTTENFTLKIFKPICEDAVTAIKKFENEEIDLVLESNMINPNEHINEHQLTELVRDVCKSLRNYGAFLMLEPEGPDMMIYMRKIIMLANKNDSLLYERMTCEHESVDLTNMKIVQDVIRKGLRVKAIESHGFSYALFEKRNAEVKTT